MDRRLIVIPIIFIAGFLLFGALNVGAFIHQESEIPNATNVDNDNPRLNDNLRADDDSGDKLKDISEDKGEELPSLMTSSGSTRMPSGGTISGTSTEDDDEDEKPGDADDESEDTGGDDEGSADENDGSGEAEGGMNNSSENNGACPTPQEIPEFPTVALPIAAILGLAFIFNRR